MKWENLHNLLCPYCDQKLEKGDKNIQCTICLFHITIERYQQMIVKRPQKGTHQKMLWQNLKEGRCPLCSNDMRPNMEGIFEILRCATAECTFKIREDSIRVILSDETHPANRFSLKK